MSRRILGLLTLVAAAALIGLTVGRLWLLGDGEPDTAGPKPTTVFSATADVQPRAHAFGDPVVARVAVLVDRTLIDPQSLRLEPRFDPYEPTGPISRAVTESGAIARISFRVPLVCLREGCEPVEGAQSLNLPSGHIFYRYQARSGRADYSFGWPAVEVVGRVPSADVEQRRWRADLTTL